MADLRSDLDALCSLLTKEGVISVKGLAQEKQLAACRGHLSARVPSMFVFDINGIALAASRFMTRDDHAGLRTTSKHLSQRMSATSSAVIQSKILVADVNGPTELFDTTSGGWETLPSMREGPQPASVSRDPRTSLRVRRLDWLERSNQFSFCFDPLQKGWRSLRPMSVRRVGAAPAVVGDHLFVSGGSEGSGRLDNSVERFGHFV